GVAIGEPDQNGRAFGHRFPAREDERGYLAQRIDFKYSGVASNISQNGLADYLIRRPDEPQRGLDRYRTGTGRAVDDVRCRHSSHQYSLAPVRTLIHVHSRPWSTLVYHPAGALINGPGRRWRMVASDSFAEFLREELTPLGRITMRRMVS